jgi:hypothetical protein
MVELGLSIQTFSRFKVRGRFVQWTGYQFADVPVKYTIEHFLVCFICLVIHDTSHIDPTGTGDAGTQ